MWVTLNKQVQQVSVSYQLTHIQMIRLSLYKPSKSIKFLQSRARAKKPNKQKNILPEFLISAGYHPIFCFPDDVNLFCGNISWWISLMSVKQKLWNNFIKLFTFNYFHMHPNHMLPIHHVNSSIQLNIVSFIFPFNWCYHQLSCLVSLTTNQKHILNRAAKNKRLLLSL